MEEEKKVFAEVKDKLEALKGWAGVLPGKCVFATPPVYKEAYPDQSEMWPVFKFAPADGLDFNDDLDDRNLYHIDAGKVQLNNGRFRTQKLKRGILDWKNRKDIHGEDIPCDKGSDGKLSDASIKTLPNVLQDWCLNMISDVSGITKEESDGLKF